MRCIILALCATAALAGQETRQDPKSEQDVKAALKEMMAQFEAAGIELDANTQSVAVKAEVGRPDQPLEFLLIHHRGKAHEALFVCDAKASLLNAALLWLGLEKGQNARVVEKDPPPTLEELENGASLVDVFPPKGKPMYFTARWKDEAGKPVEHAVGDLIIDMSEDFMVMNHEWIYLGGNMAPMYRGEPPVFVGDYEGNLVSIVYKSPPNHLVTMSHERANNDQIWWFAKIVPPAGTPVELVFHKNKPKLIADREKSIVELWKKEQKLRKKDGGDKKIDK